MAPKKTKKKATKKTARPAGMLAAEPKHAEVLALEKALTPVFKRLGITESVVLVSLPGRSKNHGVVRGWRKGSLSFTVAVTEALLQEPAVQEALMEKALATAQTIMGATDGRGESRN